MRFARREKYRDMLLNTGTAEIAHIEMLSTAVAINLEGSPMNVKEAAAEKNRWSRRFWAK